MVKKLCQYNFSTIAHGLQKNTGVFFKLSRLVDEKVPMGWRKTLVFFLNCLDLLMKKSP